MRLTADLRPLLTLVLVLSLPACTRTVVTEAGPDSDTEPTSEIVRSCATVMSFDTGPDGTALYEGQDLTHAYGAWGVTLTTHQVRDRTIAGTGTAFDSSSPPPGWADLGTPNESHGGPGSGADDGLTNHQALGNLLIATPSWEDLDHDGHVDHPVPDTDGGWFRFDFDSTACVHGLDLVDVDPDEDPAEVRAYGLDGALLLHRSPGNNGDNSVVHLDLDACGVSVLYVDLYSDGGVDNVSFCAEGEEESCDGLDNDGDGDTDEDFADTDGDGTADCVDTETCDGVDNDGDGLTDEGFPDVDYDSTADCDELEFCNGDDDDGDGTVDEGYPDSDGDGRADCLDEDYCDGLDNDGDGTIDEGQPDSDGDGTADCLDSETCDGLDNDGDGTADEGYGDIDGDGIADCVDTEDCDGRDNDADGSVDEGYADTDGDGLADCVDTDTCDGMDNDGDGAIDEDYSDTDGDGTADCIDTEDCDGLDNDGDTYTDEDFDDTDGDGLADCVDTETCDGADNDGDGATDEGFADSDGDGAADCDSACPLILDFDTDGGGNPIQAGQDVSEAYGSLWGIHIAVYDLGGTVPSTPIAFDSAAPTGGDDDLGTPNEAHGGPGIGSGGTWTNLTPLQNLLINAENTRDSDGDGLVDDPDDENDGATFVITFDEPHCVDGLTILDIQNHQGDAELLYQDADGNTLATDTVSGETGNNHRAEVTNEVCDVSVLIVTLQKDEALDELSVCPGDASEACDGLDNDGDGAVDEGFTDTDGDGTADCVDSETCDGVDNDGDGAVDEGYADTDGDGTADCVESEDCDGLDNDGDGAVDEGYTDTDSDGIADCVDTEECDELDNDGDGSVDEGFDSNGDGVPDCQECRKVIDFDSDPDGNPILAGEDTYWTYSDWGVYISVWRDTAMTSVGKVTAFDSSSPTAGETDHGTPNSAFGGPGVGSDGDTNDTALNNIGVSTEDFTDADGDGICDNPDPEDSGAWIVLMFADPICLHELKVIDVEESERTAIVYLYDTSGALVYEADMAALGDNSVETMAFDVCDIGGMMIDAFGDYGIDDIAFCPNGTDETCDGTDEDGDGQVDESGACGDLSGFDTELIGQSAGDEAGMSVADAGDYNGDGVADLLVGAWREDAGGTDAGAAYVSFGTLPGGSTSLNLADVKIVGEQADDRLGTSLDGLGDVNGDGYDDFVVGAPLNDDGTTDGGKAYLFYGPTSGTLDAGSDAALSLIGGATSGYLGTSVARAGDTDGTGVADLIVGAYGYNSGQGRAYVILDPSSSTTSTDAVFTGESVGDAAGYAVSSAGDFDGDGFDDYLIGATGDDAGGTDAGAAYLVLGPSGGSVGLASADAKWTGETTYDYAGWSVSPAGDFNGDGLDDAIVGAPLNDDGALEDGGTDSGTAYVIFGGTSGTASLGAADLIIHGVTTDDYAGYSLAGELDLDDDGRDDVVIGQIGVDGGGTNVGQVTMVAGGAWLGTYDLSLSPSHNVFTGTISGDEVGNSVHAAGDLDSDGIDDLIVGVPGANTGGTNSGQACMIYGGL